MIEVLFAESEAASMKTAKSTVVSIKTDGPTAVWSAGKKTVPKSGHTGWIEGSSDEVICLGFMLDIGNIREPIDSACRKNLIYSLYAQEQWEQDSSYDGAAETARYVYIRIAASETFFGRRRGDPHMVQ